MCDFCSGQVSKGPWELLLKLSLENIWWDSGGFGRKYIDRRGRIGGSGSVVKISKQYLEYLCVGPPV